MTRHLPGFIFGVVLGAAVTAVGSEQAHSSAEVVLENARVRVRDVTFPPGPTGMHTHELPHVGIVIQGGTLVFKYPDGKSETAKLDAGSVGFRDANVTHAPMNPGTAPVRVIEVELK
ncbi:MAG TPA: cupin domain-containing protein [Vicinamibacterales bacterium]|jgi:mannose-6-phosphate isomerase-like protein (cupin superfamily)|nr:cupin domain-containing protein [Vicinamibacterales bacterium]